MKGGILSFHFSNTEKAPLPFLFCLAKEKKEGEEKYFYVKMDVNFPSLNEKYLKQKNCDSTTIFFPYVD